MKYKHVHVNFSCTKNLNRMDKGLSSSISSWLPIGGYLVNSVRHGLYLGIRDFYDKILQQTFWDKTLRNPYRKYFKKIFWNLGMV